MISWRKLMEGAANDFVRDAFDHLKAIAADNGAQALVKTASEKTQAL